MNEEQQTIEEWLDEKIAAYILLGKEFNPTDKEKYYTCPRVINVHTPDKEIHVTHIHKIVELLSGVELEQRRFSTDKNWCEYSFMYRGYKFFEVEEEK